MQPADRGWTMALGTAAAYGHMEVLRLLCMDPRSDLGAAHNRVVRHALLHQQTEAASFLLADQRVLPNDDGGDVNRNLICDVIACDAPVTNQDKASLIRILLDRGADPNCHQHEALSRALAQKSVPVLEALIKCPRTHMTRGEFYAVLAVIPRADAYRGTLQELFHSTRFRGNFV